MNPDNFMFDTKLALELWKDGLNDRRIGEAVNAYPYQIQHWRQKNGLKANATGGRKPGHITGYHQKGPAKPKKEKRVEHLCDKTCFDCKYFCVHVGCCDYLGHTEKRRPCPAGTGCTVKEIAVQAGRGGWSQQKALELYKEGWSDVRIAEAVGATRAAICSWRKYRNMPCHTVHREYHMNWDKQKARELYDQGWSDRRIAEVVDVRPSVIWNWRAREGLERNGRKK